MQLLEYDYLAPDSINELFDGLQLMELFTGKAYYRKTKPGQKISDEDCRKKGKELLLEQHKIVDELLITADGFENSKRNIVLLKVNRSYQLFRSLISYYGVEQMLQCAEQIKVSSFKDLTASLPASKKRNEWNNIGGQLIPSANFNSFLKKITDGKVKGWDAVHAFYKQQSSNYASQKLQHALASLKQIKGYKQLTPALFKEFLKEYLATKEWMVKGIYESRAKDYTNPFRKMVYQNEEEMQAVTGSLADNSFIKKQQTELELVKKKIQKMQRLLK